MKDHGARQVHTQQRSPVRHEMADLQQLLSRHSASYLCDTITVEHRHMAPAHVHAPQQSARGQAGSCDGCMAQELWHLPRCACNGRQGTSAGRSASRHGGEVLGNDAEGGWAALGPIDSGIASRHQVRRGASPLSRRMPGSRHAVCCFGLHDNVGGDATTSAACSTCTNCCATCGCLCCAAGGCARGVC